MDIRLEIFHKTFLKAYQLSLQNIFFAVDCELASVEDGNTTNVILCLVDEFGKF